MNEKQNRTLRDSHLCVHCESFALFAVKLNRKGRKVNAKDARHINNVIAQATFASGVNFNHSKQMYVVMK